MQVELWVFIKLNPDQGDMHNVWILRNGLIDRFHHGLGYNLRLKLQLVTVSQK